MADYSWNASAGGDWNTATNWTLPTVPGAADTATFDLGFDSYTVTGDANVAAIAVASDAVTFDGQIFVGNATAGLTATNAAYVTIDSNAFIDDSGALAFDPGTTLEVDGQLVSDGGTLDTVLMTGGAANWADAATITLNQLYVYSGASFAGNLTLDDGGSLTLDTSATFGGGTVSLAGGGAIYAALAPLADSGAFGFTDAIVTGAGTLDLASDPTVTLNVTGPISGAGNVLVSGGTVNFVSGNTYAGITAVDSATLSLAGPNAAGTGPIFLQDATLNLLADTTGAGSNELVVGAGGADTIDAAAAFSSVFGGAAVTLDFQGGFGSSLVVGGSGVLTATAGAGGDELFGGTSGQDVLTAGTGPTTLVGGAGGMLVASGSAADVLVAAGGNTTLNGAQSTGTESFFTQGSGSTTIQGGTGQNLIVASGATNLIDGSGGTLDVFLGAGANQFAFTDGSSGGTNLITGFAAGDVINLSGYSATEAQTALSGATIIGTSTFITLSDNTHISLFGYTGLTAANFT